MGSVWKARIVLLDVDVAVKVIKRSAGSRRASLRLLSEASAMAKLDHPSIVRFYDCGFTDAGEPFLVMQLLRGRTLGAWLRARGRLDASTAVQLILPIVDALAEAHALGIVHRDLKPENILLVEGSNGELTPKLLDFGIAKQTRAPAKEGLTKPGIIVGSPAYMSPEQVRRKGEVAPHSDIWSLCVTLYELITGKRPFDASGDSEVLCKVLADAPEPTHMRGVGDRDLWAILRRGLEKAPSDRWSSMKELGAALAAWALAQGVTVDIMGRSLSHKWLRRGALPAEGSARIFSALRAPLAAMPPGRRRWVLALCGVCCVLAGVGSFLALAPDAAQVEAATVLRPPVRQPDVLATPSVELRATIGPAAEINTAPEATVAAVMKAPVAEAAPARGRERSAEAPATVPPRRPPSPSEPRTFNPAQP